MTNLIQRPGIDHDPIKPWVWGTLLGHANPVEVVSYPCPPETPTGEADRFGLDRGMTIMVRLMPGDPTSMVEVPLARVACFDRSRHEWDQRPKRYYSDDPTAFHFDDAEAAEDRRSE